MISRDPTSWIASRRIGDATVTVISEGELPLAPELNVPEATWRQAIPEVDEQGRFWFGLNVALIQTGEATIVIDPGLDDPGSAWQRSFATLFDGMTRTPGLQAAMTSLGVAPEAVTHVLITHAHNDHYAGVVVEHGGDLCPRFPRARHYIGRADWEEPLDLPEPEPELAERLGLIAGLGLLETVEGDREILPGVTMLAAPGETRGHMVVRLESVGEVVYALGDLVHHACEVTHPDWVFQGSDPVAARASRERIFAAAAHDNALVFTGHEPFPAWARIVPHGSGFRWEPLS
jgi:glyoxylase-like metal-dependent hydrolase (beta-lactamase superfamily II)